jgi:carboxyl-terminal processing protease
VSCQEDIGPADRRSARRGGVRRALVVGLAATLGAALGPDVAGPALARAAPPAAIALVDGPVDETLKEVILSLDASSVVRVPPERYATLALDALSAFDSCLARETGAEGLRLSCAGSTVTLAWPPPRALDVALLLTQAARLVDPERVVRPARVAALCRALAMAVDDPFTAYLTPSMVASAAARNHGIAAATPGIELWPRDPARVRDVRLGSDAAAKGITAGDRLVAVDDVDVTSLNYLELLQRMSGMNASDLKLVVQSGQGGGARTVDVARLLVPEHDIRRAMLGSVLYVGVPVFKSGTADSVRQALGAGVYSGVILDLRHNGGGLLAEGVALVDLFLRDGVIGGVRSGPGRPTEDYVAHRDSFDSTLPLVVLIDGVSASASEFTAMVLKDRGRAILLGGTTAGKGSLQRQIPTPDGGLLKVTAGYYVGPTGRRLDEGGVRPHRFLAPSAQRTALEGGDVRGDSWVLSALDALQRVERTAVMTPAIGPVP